MKGIDAKVKLKQNGIKLKTIAEKVNFSQQKLYSLFESDSMKVETLEMIAKAAGKTIQFFIGEIKEESNVIVNVEIAKLNTIIEERDKTVERQEKRIEELIKKLALEESKSMELMKERERDTGPKLDPNFTKNSPFNDGQKRKANL